MAIYNYIALKNNKNIVKGKIEGESLKEARENVRKLGFLPTKISEENKVVVESKTTVAVKSIQKLSLQDKIEFTSTFQILAQSGIPIIESLMFIENDAANIKIKLIAKEIRRQIMAGSTFAADGLRARRLWRFGRGGRQ